jgi:hypothetical protein
MPRENKLSDEVVENRRKIKIASSAFKEIDIANIGGGGEGDDDSDNDGDGTDGTETAANADLGEQGLNFSTDLTINGVSEHTDLIGTNISSEILIDILSSTNSVSIDKIVIGSGTTNTTRRETNFLDNPITPVSETQNITNNTDSLTIDATIEYDESKTLSEVAIQLSNGDLLQYDLV